ncbi:MAG TPA: class I SAM-dependent methyltransferase [Polyangia bacterium]|nr:class I SAM-dependent methyltransferase [Polyangia bacterium]
MARSGTTTEAASSPAEVYDALAPIYDGVGGAQSFAMMVAERLERLLALRRPQPAPADALSILDLGCGTGTLLCALRALHPGWRLAGVDVSAGMLAVAWGKPGSDGVLWVRARLPGPLPFTERFDVVGAFYDTLNHLPDLDALAAAFRTAAALLHPGGLLVFDLNNAFGFETWWRYRVALDVEDHRIDTALGYDRHARLAHAAIGIARGGVERRFLLHQRCFSEAEVEGALFRAGFTPEVAAPWGPVDPDSPSKTWFVAAKKHQE